MYPIRKNFYNKDIFMIHKEKLISLISKTENPMLKNYIYMLLKKYKSEVEFLNTLPYELRSWPNCYIGLSISDERNYPIIKLAMKERLNDNVLSFDYLASATGNVFLDERYELAKELAKLKKLFFQFSIVTIKTILQVVTEDTLNYLLAYIQTNGKVTTDKRIVFYNGEKYIVLDTLLNHELADNIKYSSYQLNYK